MYIVNFWQFTHLKSCWTMTLVNNSRIRCCRSRLRDWDNYSCLTADLNRWWGRNIPLIFNTGIPRLGTNCSLSCNHNWWGGLSCKKRPKFLFISYNQQSRISSGCIFLKIWAKGKGPFTNYVDKIVCIRYRQNLRGGSTDENEKLVGNFVVEALKTAKNR